MGGLYSAAASLFPSLSHTRLGVFDAKTRTQNHQLAPVSAIGYATRDWPSGVPCYEGLPVNREGWTEMVSVLVCFTTLS